MAEQSQELRVPSILIIDDSPHICECLRDIIVSEGYRAMVVGGGLEGLAALQNAGADPDLIVSGWAMADMDALDFLRAVRRTKPGAHLPVIMLADLAIEATVARQSVEAISEAYLLTSFGLQDLLDTIKDAFSTGKAGV